MSDPLAVSNYINAKRGDEPTVTVKAPHSHRIFSASRFCKRMSNTLQSNYSYFAEASISPIKYALFQYLGRKCIRMISTFEMLPLYLSGTPSESLSSAKIGILGGAVVGSFYLALLCNKRHIPQDDISVYAPIWWYTLIFGKEILCSVAAGVIGAAINRQDTAQDFIYIVAAAVLGPILLLFVLLGILGIIITFVWSAKWLKDRCGDR